MKINLPHEHGENINNILLQCPPSEEFTELSDIFQQLSDPNRLRLFWILCHCEECVMNLSAIMNMSSPALSHHLRYLKGGNLIEKRRDGKEVYYRAANTVKARALHEIIKKMLALSCPNEDSPIKESSCLFSEKDINS